MGLDMFLYSIPKVKGLSFSDLMDVDRRLQANEELTEEEKVLVDGLVKTERGNVCSWNTLFETIGYWRKARHIHNWFVVNVKNGEDDCERHEVSKCSLEKLLHVCEKALNNNDQYCFEDIEKTIKITKRALSMLSKGDSYIVYYSSW